MQSKYSTKNLCLRKIGLIHKPANSRSSIAPIYYFAILNYRRRMFLLTEGPHLYYVDASAMVLKGEIPWSATMKTELRDFRIFFVHVPGRIYYLIDNESTSKDWCAAIGKYVPLKNMFGSSQY